MYQIVTIKHILKVNLNVSNIKRWRYPTTPTSCVTLYLGSLTFVLNPDFPAHMLSVNDKNSFNRIQAGKTKMTPITNWETLFEVK